MIEVKGGTVQRVVADREIEYVLVDRDNMATGDIECDTYEADDVKTRSALRSEIEDIESEYKILRE